MEITPCSDWILINKAINDHVRNDDGSILVAKPDKTLDTTCWAEIIDVGPKCKYITKDMCGAGYYIDAPELSDDMKKWYQDENDECNFFFIRESYLMADKSGRAYVVKA